MELAKLLRNSENKLREVRGKPLSDRLGDEALARPVPIVITISVSVVSSVAALDAPADIFSGCPMAQGRMIVSEPSALTGPAFVRIPVTFDCSDSDEEEDEVGGQLRAAASEVGTVHAQSGGGFRRMAILEDDDEEVESDVVSVGHSAQKLASSSESVHDESDRYRVSERSALQDAAAALKEAGNDFLLQGQYAEAVRAYDKSLEHFPQFVAALGNRAQAHLLSKVWQLSTVICAVMIFSFVEFCSRGEGLHLGARCGSAEPQGAV